MKTYQEMSKEELTQELTALKAEYEKIKGMGLALDMSRGKPGADQLDLSMGMLDVLDSKTALKSENGTDLRNYGVLMVFRKLKTDSRCDRNETGKCDYIW